MTGRSCPDGTLGPVPTDIELAALLPALTLQHWGDTALDVRPLGGGMNSSTARVRLVSGQYVAKWVAASFVGGATAGLAESLQLAERGLATGAPLPTASGALCVDLDEGVLALLRWVPGAELAGDSPGDQQLIGRTLARAHTLGDPTIEPTRRFFDWFDEDSPYLDAAPTLRVEVTGALAAYDALPPLTWGLLHTDPAPEAFRHDPASGDTGLIDWAGARRGPLLYDVASAVMYLGGPPAARPFLDAYLSAAPLPASELDHLPALSRYRGAVQAAYFAERLSRADLTGTDEAGNRQGFADGLSMLRDLS